MNKNEQLFFKNLIISERDRECALKYLKSKGVKKHLMIKEKLLAWSESENIEYTKVASTYRYDKRLRIVLYKYVSYLEEFYRSIIEDNYSLKSIFDIKLEEDLKYRIGTERDLSKALELIDFSVLLFQMMKLPRKKRKLWFFPKKFEFKNIIALRELRNAVMHNKFLLVYMFEECIINGETSSTLRSNILNLISFLPEEVGEKCKKEINRCSEDRNGENETKWDLPSFVEIKI